MRRGFCITLLHLDGSCVNNENITLTQFTCRQSILMWFMTWLFCSSCNAIALTVQNIVQQLRGVDLFEIKYDKSLLAIPPSKLRELKYAYGSTDQQEAAVVRYWLLRDPLASWREIIRQLDFWASNTDYGHYSDIADRIRHYAEELTGMCFFIKPLIQHYPCLARD